MAERKVPNGKTEPHATSSIVNGKPVEKSKLEKAVGVFLSEDISNVKGSIVEDYIMPRAEKLGKDAVRKGKEFILDSITGAVSIILFGTAKDRKSGYYNGQKVNYYNYSSSYSERDDRREDRRYEPANRVKRISIPSYGEAEKVLEELNSYIARYKVASVGDFYQLVNISPTKSDFSYGWFDLVGADIIYNRFTEGYVIEFPKPQPLE